MLKILFTWFDRHPHSYWIIATISTLAFLGWLTFSILNDSKPRWAKSGAILFPALVFAVLLAWRWPFLLSADEYNPDESQLIAGAITLRADPIPWRGVDGFTSGPLNFYPLLLPRLVGLPVDYFTARLMGLLLVWGALLACYRLFLSWFERSWAGLSIVPALAFFCTVTDSDFIHYSSEHLSLFLVALSACCVLAQRRTAVAERRWLSAGCLVAGLLPWAKLQSGPFAAVLVLAALINATRDKPSLAERLRASVGPLSAAALPTVLLLSVITVSGQLEHFIHSYLAQNFTYVGNGTSLEETVGGLWRTTRATNHYPIFLGTSLAVITVGAVAGRFSKRGPSWFILLGLSIASALCILTPRRAFVHYLLLSIIPLSLWFGVTLAQWGSSLRQQGRVCLGLSVLLIGCLLPFGFRATQPVPEVFGNFAIHWQEPRSMLADLIRSCALPRSRLAVWGWLPRLYVESGLPQGTRDGNTSWAITPSPHQEYYLQRFLADLKQREPDLFVDAVGEGSSFFTDRATAGHENFPALASYIRAHYQLISDLGYARLYAKNGMPNLERESDSAVAARDFGPSLVREKLNPPDLPQRRLKNGFVQMMRPPAEMVWSLDETTREVLVEYGFSPEAYRIQNRSDGVELIFELHSPNAPVRHLFYRELDPRHRPEDRGPTTSLLILPPFKAGSKLVARTTVGLAGDGAWDWVYIARASPVRLPSFSPAQFPGFNRVPDSADADLSYLLKEPGENVLILHAPARLTYNLDGRENRLRFDYGFREGAYTKGGQTDGAIFRVELRGAADIPEILFEKRLDPLGSSDDRGAHSADFPIPAGRAGARLIIQIDPGKGNAWDWTFLNHFTLE